MCSELVMKKYFMQLYMTCVRSLHCMIIDDLGGRGFSETVSLVTVPSLLALINYIHYLFHCAVEYN